MRRKHREEVLDDLLRNYKPQPLVEPPSPIVVVGEDKFTALMERYRRFLDEGGVQYQNLREMYQKTQDISTILTPEEINNFLQMTIENEHHGNYQMKTGIFFNKLIQNSYDAGNNDFHLDTTALVVPLNYLCALIKGKKEKFVTISLRGNIGRSYGFESSNGKSNITGNVGSDCGSLSKNGTYIIAGNAGDGFGMESEYCEYLIAGNAKYHFGFNSRKNIYVLTGNVDSSAGVSSEDCTYVFMGNTGIGLGTNSDLYYYFVIGAVGDYVGSDARQCTFRTPNEETAKKFSREVPNRNTVIYSHPNGYEEVMRR